MLRRREDVQPRGAIPRWRIVILPHNCRGERLLDEAITTLERAGQAPPRTPVPPPSEAPTASGQSCLDDLKDVDWIGPAVLLDVPAYETETLTINMYARDCKPVRLDQNQRLCVPHGRKL